MNEYMSKEDSKIRSSANSYLFNTAKRFYA